MANNMANYVWVWVPVSVGNNLLQQTRRQPRQGGGQNKAWSDEKPHSMYERRELYNRCGSRCFLGAQIAQSKHLHGAHTSKPNYLKFPICDSTCHVRPEALQAARQRARLVQAKNKKYHRKRSHQRFYQAVERTAKSRSKSKTR